MFRRFEAADPDPKSELEYVNPFTLLVAVVLSAQATDAGVNKATRALFKIADTPEKMVRLGEDSVRDFIKTIGLYRNKARNVIELSRQLIANHGGEVPRASRGAGGVAGRRPQDRQRRSQRRLRRADDGRRYARFSCGQPHRSVERARPVGGRGGSVACGASQYGMHAHHWLILHGRYVCKARRPECPRCIINDLCLYAAKTTWPD